MANNTQAPHKPPEHDMFLLGGIAGIIRWFESLIQLLSGPLLTVGLAIALIDLLTDGGLLARYEWLLYVWASTQAVGVDVQLVMSWDRVAQAWRAHRWWAVAGYIILGLALAYIAWIAAQVFALQESEGITTAAALARLGMDSASWLVQRTALSVILVCLAGLLRYHKPPKDTQRDAAQELEELEAELALQPLREQLHVQQARGMRSILAAARGKTVTPAASPPAALRGASVTQSTGDVTQANDDTPPDMPPDGSGGGSSPRTRNGTPAQSTSGLAPLIVSSASGSSNGNSARPVNIRRARAARNTRAAIVGDGLTERQRAQRRKVHAILAKEPGITAYALAKRVGCGWKQAQQYITNWQREQSDKQLIAQ